MSRYEEVAFNRSVTDLRWAIAHGCVNHEMRWGKFTRKGKRYCFDCYVQPALAHLFREYKKDQALLAACDYWFGQRPKR